MKIFLNLILIIYMYTMTAGRSIVSKEESSYQIKYAEPLNRTKEISFQGLIFKDLTSPDPQLIRDIRYIMKNIGAWMIKKENEDTFIGRCFGVARQIKFAMPIILVKLGVIVTILVFLTIFSLKTMGLILVMFMFGASSAFAKLALWKTESAHHLQKPQNVHFHIHQGKHGQYDFAPAASPWERTSSENLNNNLLGTDEEFQEKLNYLAKYQKGLFNAYSTN